MKLPVTARPRTSPGCFPDAAEVLGSSCSVDKGVGTGLADGLHDGPLGQVRAPAAWPRLCHAHCPSDVGGLVQGGDTVEVGRAPGRTRRLFDRGRRPTTHSP